jgi:hypothetical protein
MKSEQRTKFRKALKLIHKQKRDVPEVLLHGHRRLEIGEALKDSDKRRTGESSFEEIPDREIRSERVHIGNGFFREARIESSDSIILPSGKREHYRYLDYGEHLREFDEAHLHIGTQIDRWKKINKYRIGQKVDNHMLYRRRVLE